MRPPPKPKSPIATRQQRRPFPPLKYDKRLLLQVDELLKEASFVDTSRSLTQEDVSRSQLGMSKEQQDWVYAHLQLCRAPQIQTQRRVDGYIKHLEYMCVDPAALWKDTDGQDTLMSDGELGHLLDDFYDPPKSTEQAQGVVSGEQTTPSPPCTPPSRTFSASPQHTVPQPPTSSPRLSSSSRRPASQQHPVPQQSPQPRSAQPRPPPRALAPKHTHAQITPRSLSSSATSKRSPTGPTITGVDPNNGHSPEEERYALLSLSRSEEPLNQRRSNREVIPNTINVFMVPRTPPQASLTPPTPHAAHPSVVIEELLVGEQVFSAADMTEIPVLSRSRTPSPKKYARVLSAAPAPAAQSPRFDYTRHSFDPVSPSPAPGPLLPRPARSLPPAAAPRRRR